MTFEEWFHKEYEPADIQIEDMIANDEEMKCPAKVYKNDLEIAFNAGLHADVHTDNSEVIEQLKKENDELRQQLCSYTKQKEYIIKLENLIEKMKCCGNCKHQYEGQYHNGFRCKDHYKEEVCESYEWELAE